MDKEEQQLETKKECTEQILTAQWNAVQDWPVVIKPTKSGWFVLQTATVLPSCFTWVQMQSSPSQRLPQVPIVFAGDEKDEDQEPWRSPCHAADVVVGQY